MEYHPSMVFQHDNHPVHKSHIVKNYIRAKGWEILEWPARSPDLNPIENVWGLLKQKLYRETFNSVEDMKDFIFKWWNSLKPGYFRNLYESMSDRCEKVIAYEGNTIPY